MPATWRAQLRPAAFRGVPFLVRVAEGDYGRRLASHDYPLRDDPWHEDMGRKPKTIQLEAYVVEPDHIGQAKALIVACEKPGSGTLTHPWLGDLNVVVAGCHPRFDHDAGGMATFALSFIEAGQALYPAPVRNATGSVDRVAAAAKEAITGQLLQRFSLAGVTGWVAGQATTVLGETLSEIAGSLTPAPGSAAAWAADIANAADTAATLVRNPLSLATRVLALLDIGNLSAIPSIVQTGLAVASAAETFTRPDGFDVDWRSFLQLTGFGFVVSDTAAYRPTAATARQAATNTAALTGFVRRAATVEMARAAVRQDYATTDDAAAAAETIAEIVDRELPLAGDADGQALQAVAVATQQVIAARLPELPRSLVFTTVAPVAAGTVTAELTALGRRFGYAPGATLPAIVIAQAVYGDAIGDVAPRAEQIVGRNRVPHPLFVRGGEPLELLSVV